MSDQPKPDRLREIAEQLWYDARPFAGPETLERALRLRDEALISTCPDGVLFGEAWIREIEAWKRRANARMVELLKAEAKK